MRGNFRVIVTGSAGFIGFHASKLLADSGHQVVGIDSLTDYYDVSLKEARTNILKCSKQFSFLKLDIENSKSLERLFNDFKPHIVIHLAAQAGVRYSLENPRKYLETNITGTFNVLEESKKVKVDHLLMASSSSVYGSNDTYPFCEGQKCASPLSIYAATKASNEQIAHAYSHLYKIPITMLRFFTVYGPYGRPDMALFKFVKNILARKKIDVYNKGKMKRDFTYVGDVVNAINLLLDKIPKKTSIGSRSLSKDSLSKVAPYRVLNIGNSNPIYLLNFISCIEDSLGIKASCNFLSMQKGDVKETTSNCELLYSLTGFQPETPIEIGIKNFVTWYKDYYKIK